MRRSIFTLALTTVLTLSWTASAQDYSVTKFPTLGGNGTYATAVNKNGEVVGVSGTSVVTSSHAFFWSKAAGIQDIGGGADSAASAVNDNGVVAGYSNPCYCQNVAFWWSAAGGKQNIKSPGQLWSVASGINNSNEIVGTYYDTSAKSFLWTQLEGMKDLGTLGCVRCLASAINDSNQVVGGASQSDGSQHAFLWSEAGGMVDLGTLGGPNSRAIKINASGQIVGISDTAGGVQHAFLWTETTGMQDLGTLAGYDHSWALSIDAAGRVVGFSWNTGRGMSRPFSWTSAHGMQKLGPFRNLDGQSADGVNSAGQILISSYVGNGPTSWIVTPLMHTTMSSSSNPSKAGDPVTFTANVISSVQGPPPDGELVAFKSGGQVLATVPLQSGVARFTTVLKATKSIRAVYAGDANYETSQSPLLKQVVVK